MVEEEKEQQGEDEEKEESEPGSPQYDDTQRKTTQLVPEEMKVNKVPEKNEVDDEDGAEKINEEQVEGEGKEEVQVEEVARPLSREDIRNARLAALEKRMAANTEENKEEEVVGDDSDSKK